MNARIVNFRQSRTRVSGNQMILTIDGVSDREAAQKLVGKSATWKTPSGKELKGTVKSAHGNSGAVCVHFETGMPGQSLGTAIELK